MIYTEYKPHQSLEPYIRCYWVLEGDAMPEPVPEKIVPDGCTEMIFHYGDPYVKREAGSDWEKQPVSFIYGQIMRYIEIMPTGKTGIFSVRFLPAGLYAFLQFPCHKIMHTWSPLENIIGNEGKKLEASVLKAGHTQERISILETFLLERIRNYDPGVFWYIGHSVKRILETHGEITLKALSDEAGVGERQLERRFLHMAGINPKRFAKIIRFARIFELIRNSPSFSLTELAYEAGYYDQAHFIRNFKDLAGVSPGQYFNDTHRISDYFTSGPV